MKFSQFNTFIPYEGKMLSYNAYADKYLLLEPMLYDMLDSARATRNFADLENVHPSFYQALVGSGFLIGDDENEIEKVRTMMEAIDNSSDTFRLIVNPTMNCNFKCWYCYETHIKESKMDTETIGKISRLIDSVFEYQKNLKLFALSWFGGEPLLYYDRVVAPLMEYAYNAATERNVTYTCDFTTNGFLIRSHMLPFFRRTNVIDFQITLDGNRENHNKVRYVSETRGSYDEIVANIKMLAREGFHVTLRINYTGTNIDGLEQILDDFWDLDDQSKRSIEFSLHQVWQDGNRQLGPRVAQFRKLARELGFSNTHSILADTVRYSCYADKRNQATVNYNGDVFKCTARDFTEKNREGTLTADGRIEWNEKLDTRMTAKLKNKPCLECAILPICGGGCSQKAMENLGRDYCVNYFDEDRKKRIVLDRFVDTFIHVHP